MTVEEARKVLAKAFVNIPPDSLRMKYIEDAIRAIARDECGALFKTARKIGKEQGYF